MAETNSPVITLHADQEHSAIRLTVPLLLLLAFCLSYLLLTALLNVAFPRMDSRVLIACVGAIPIGLSLAWLAELALKRAWPSGRKVVLHESGVDMHPGEGTTLRLERDRKVNLTLWYFGLSGYPRGGRERRVNRNWFCFSMAVQQDEARAIFFCFVRPETKERWLDRYSFHRIKPGDVYESSLTTRVSLPTRPELSPRLIAGKHGRYWLAERDRWEEGMELTPEDFEILLERLYTFEEVHT